MLGNTSDIHARVLNFTSKKLLAFRFIAHKFVVRPLPPTSTSHPRHVISIATVIMVAMVTPLLFHVQ